MEKLYGLFSVISKKTVRRNEKMYKKSRNRNVPGVLVQTNRGYFIDGKQVDNASVKLWFEMSRGNYDNVPKLKS